MVNPKLFLVTIPVLFQLLCETASNWLIIKLLKLLTELYKVEPRLGGKLAKKFMEMLESEAAKSVQFELIKSSFGYFSDQAELVALAKDKLRSFLTSNDNNLQYLGLEALKELL